MDLKMIKRLVIPEVKPVAMDWWKSVSPILWATAIVVLPEIISDLSALKPEQLWWKWGLRFLIVALKITLDKLTHKEPKTGDNP